MSEVLELNREEIKRLTKMEDSHGHAWVLYLMLKKNMDIYTGLVQVNNAFLHTLLAQKYNLCAYGCQQLINSLKNAEVIFDYLSTDDMLSVKLPIALNETCLENSLHH